MPKKTNEAVSLNVCKTIHGVEIKKMPCGKYFEALQELKNLPTDFIKEVSKGVEFKLSDVFQLENLLNLIAQLAIITPNFMFKFLSKLFDVKEDYLRDSLTPSELIEVCKVFWEVNNLENFFNQMKPVVKKLTELIGFSAQSQSVLK